MIPKITVLKEQKRITVQKGFSRIIVPLETKRITVKQGLPRITVPKEIKRITVKKETPPSVCVQKEEKRITVKQGFPRIQINKEEKHITVKQGLPKITVQKKYPKITVICSNNMVNIIPFSVVATSNGQTVFVLPYSYRMIICLFVMGTGQDPIAGDYTVSGNQITLGSTAPYINAGDLVFGSGQIA